MKEKYDVPIASESEFISYMMEQMSQFGLPCTEEQAKDFYVYYARMIETNKYLNLTGITDMKEVVVKHMIDSLSCYDPNIIKSGMSIIDVGTGAGFPGIPLAIYDRSLKVILFDSLKKRLTFLESVIDESTYAEIKYPCLLLNGASTNEEVDFLRSFSTEKNNSKAIYLYCEAAQGVCEIGYIKLTLKFLLTLSRMPGYRLYSLYSDTSERNEIKLDDPEVLSNFISL